MQAVAAEWSALKRELAAAPVLTVTARRNARASLTFSSRAHLAMGLPDGRTVLFDEASVKKEKTALLALLGACAAAGLKAFGFYAHWYPGLLLPRGGAPSDFTPAFKSALAYAAKTSRRLARTLFHAMAKNGPPSPPTPSTTKK